MFLVTLFHQDNGFRKARKLFNSLMEAQEFCDYYENLGWVIFGIEVVDYTLSDNLIMA